MTLLTIDLSSIHKGQITMDMNRLAGMRLLEETIGLPKIEVISNEFKEFPTGNEEGEFNTFYKIVFQIDEEEPDIYAVGVLFCLSLMSFTISVSIRQSKTSGAWIILRADMFSSEISNEKLYSY